MEHKEDHPEVGFWYTSSNDKALDFLKNIGEYIKPIVGSMTLNQSLYIGIARVVRQSSSRRIVSLTVDTVQSSLTKSILFPVAKSSWKTSENTAFTLSCSKRISRISSLTTFITSMNFVRTELTKSVLNVVFKVLITNLNM